MKTAPYGEWTSPISADALAAGSHPTAGARFVGDEIWWAEMRPAEAGRYTIRRYTPDGTAEDLLPAPWNARTRVHEYGGGAWTVTDDGVIVFAEFGDQRLYRLVPGHDPVPLTPAPDEPAGMRYAELSIVGGEVWCVRERHSGATVTRDIAAVPLDGSAATEPSAARSVIGGSHFLAAPRVSPAGTSVAWIAWEHPQMPWDGTELRVADLDTSGVAGPARTLIGSTTESVLQPEWADDSSLYAISDRSGFWNLYRVPADGGEPTPLCPVDADFAGPMWELGASWYRVLDEQTLLTVRTSGTDTLGVFDLQSGQLRDVDLAAHTRITVGARRDRSVLLTTSGARVPRGVRVLDLDTGALTDVRVDADDLPDAGYFSECPHDDLRRNGRA